LFANIYYNAILTLAGYNNKHKT